VHLTDHESSGLAAAALQAQVNVGDLPAVLRQKARLGWEALSSSTVAMLELFARGQSRRPELYIDNLPVDVVLPPTPVRGQSTEVLGSGLSEFVMSTFALALGLPISYLDQRGGRLFHDIYPTAVNASEVSSQSSSVRLGFHSEMFFHPEPPDFLVLHCLRADRAGQAMTGVAAVEDITAHLAAAEREILGLDLYAPDLASLHGSYRNQGRAILESDPRPVLPVLGDASSLGGGRVRFEPGLTTALTVEARLALERADDVAEQVAAEGRLCEGGLLIIDNRRAVHSRSSFPATFDGTDRWLRRMMVGAATDASNGYHDRPDLEIAAAWAARGVELRHVPYPAAEHQQVSS